MLTVRLDTAIENQLNSFAQQRHLPKSTIVKEALVYYFEMLKNNSKQKSPYELGVDFFGKFESSRSDLSTTYKERLKDKINEKNSHR